MDTVPTPTGGWNASPRDRAHAEWFSWARQTLKYQIQQAHAAAEAAIDANPAGADPEAAMNAARHAHASAGTPNLLPAAKVYSLWFDWARTTEEVDAERAHGLAAVATLLHMTGAPEEEVVDAVLAARPALRAVSPPPAQ